MTSLFWYFALCFFGFIGSIERVEEAAATKCGCHRSWFIVRFFSPGVSVLESMSSYNVSFASNGMLGLSLRNLSLSCCVSVPASLSLRYLCDISVISLWYLYECASEPAPIPDIFVISLWYLCDISVISLRMCFRACSDPWYLCDISVIFLWYLCYPVISLWYLCDISVLSLWYLFAIFVISPCYIWYPCDMCRRRDMLALSCRFVWLRSGIPYWL